MDTFYITYEEFWDWFDRGPDSLWATPVTSKPQGVGQLRPAPSAATSAVGYHNDLTEQPVVAAKRKKIRDIRETAASGSGFPRYIVMYGRPKPGRKNKTWEDDGFLTIVGQTAHLCNTRGQMVEEPTALDEIDLETIADCGELIIGGTEVNVLELDDTK